MVERSLSMREVRGSIPCTSKFFSKFNFMLILFPEELNFFRYKKIFYIILKPFFHSAMQSASGHMSIGHRIVLTSKSR